LRSDRNTSAATANYAASAADSTTAASAGREQCCNAKQQHTDAQKPIRFFHIRNPDVS
jgi:hypothetical protein